MNPVDLIQHPEGGRFREVFRSKTTVRTPNGTRRSALTHIYFSLNSGEKSRFHRVGSDEVWNLYKGSGIRLYLWDEADNNAPECISLSSSTNCFCCIVPAGTWQAAKPIAGTVLVGCSVAPGFDFADFELIDPDSVLAKRLVSIAPDLAELTMP
jgi:predicted cupin superfamily sugar epimerase